MYAIFGVHAHLLPVIVLPLMYHLLSSPILPNLSSLTYPLQILSQPNLTYPLRHRNPSCTLSSRDARVRHWVVPCYQKERL